MRLSIPIQRSRLCVGDWYTNGRDVRQIVNIKIITVEVEDAKTGDISIHGIGGFRRNWWLVKREKIDWDGHP